MSVPETEQGTPMPDESGTVNEEISAWCEPKPDFRLDRWTSLGEFWVREPRERRWVPAHDFFYSRDACAQFERLVRKKGLAMKYSVALYETVPDREMAHHRDWWICIGWSATAEQRCAAMLRVIRETR